MGTNEVTADGATFRRVVTGHDRQGRSVCLLDDRTCESAGWIHNLWLTPPGPADNTGVADPLAQGGAIPLAAASGGSLFRLFRVPSRSYLQSLTDEQIEATFASLGAGAARRQGAGHRLMHATQTLDYIVVLQGRVTLHLDDGDVHLGPLDTVIQRGTSHGWPNDSDDWAPLDIALIGAERLTARHREE